MALILYMLGRTRSPPSHPCEQATERRRLQKPFRNTKKLYSCKDIFEVVQAQSCLTLFTEPDDELTLADLSEEENSTNDEDMKPTIPHVRQAHIGQLLRTQPSVISQDSMSVYSTDEKEVRVFRRTRPKTPVFLIGQLERNCEVHPLDEAQNLAVQYQAELPSRSFTPCQRPRSIASSRPLRKIKCQISLRDMMKDQCQRSPSMTSSDTDTLVGTDSPTSPDFASYTKQSLSPESTPRASIDEDPRDSPNPVDSEAGLKICMDLLTNELASTLFRQHPEEGADRASGLQILLMIEAYETVQKHLRQQLYANRLVETRDTHMEEVEKILTHWLQVLYSVYDRSQEIKGEKDLQVIEEELEVESPPVLDLPATAKDIFEDSRRSWEDIFTSLI